jgi:SAM-dependent methyltransferase
MIFLILVVVILFVCFGGVLLFGAPYLPTLRTQIDTMFELSKIKPGQTIIELGCGDGRILAEAAKRGIKGVGYELNPLLVIYAKIKTRKYKELATIKWANFWIVDWPEADFIFTFLLDRYMGKLDTKISSYKYLPVTLITFAFKIPDREILKQKNSIYLYRYR